MLCLVNWTIKIADGSIIQSSRNWIGGSLKKSHP
uniref:Uncharacterized protein n=1 Tax=Rhizophora mucronata TaxID=61149 RepID=A0A2P2NGZ9_RHIMU